MPELKNKLAAPEGCAPLACSPLGNAHDRYVAARDNWLKQPMSESMKGEIYGEYIAAHNGYLAEIGTRESPGPNARNRTLQHPAHPLERMTFHPYPNHTHGLD